MPNQETPPARRKRIIVCCDGTWQSATSGKKNVPSNVTRLARELDRVGVDVDGQEWQQVVWYDSGVGTTSLLGRKSEGATGSGLEINVIEAYSFIALNWTPGDKVYCFGFSRGAFTARSIAGLISDIGICEPRMLQHFSELWGLYKANTEDRFWGSKAYWEFMDGKLAEPLPETPGYKNSNYTWESRPKGDWARTVESREIEIVGVYDTVGALGMPSLRGYEVGWLLGYNPKDYEFFNVRLNRSRSKICYEARNQLTDWPLQTSSVHTMPWPWTNAERLLLQPCSTYLISTHLRGLRSRRSTMHSRHCLMSGTRPRQIARSQ